MTTRAENLGAAERIIQMLLAYTDHMVHNRPGVLTPDSRSPVGVTWQQCTHRMTEGQKVVFRQTKSGKKTVEQRVGVMQADNTIVENGQQVGRYQPAGIFAEVAFWMYRQVAEIWQIDNEFVARWASFAFPQEHKDLKVVLAAFLLVQSRKGDPVREGGKIAFYDDDYRAVGEAMLLLTRKDRRDFDPKLVMRVRQVLEVPAVAKLNHQLGFGVGSERRAFLGRWDMAVKEYLRFRAENPKMLEGAVKGGFRRHIKLLTAWSRFHAESPKFYEVMRWPQRQADDGHRKMALDMTLEAQATWEGLDERQICERIVAEKPAFKRVVGLLPKGQTVTRAIMSAAVESGCLTDKELLIATPTLEELGLLQDPTVKQRWEAATKVADDQRAANIAQRVKSREAREKLQDAADTAVKRQLEEVTRGIRLYVLVDISASQQGAIEASKSHISRFLQGIPLDKLHVAVFNTAGREVEIKHPSAVGVQNAFRGITASGGTNHASGVRAISQHKPAADEDAFMLFFGDEEDNAAFDATIRNSGIQPVAFGLCRIIGPNSNGMGACVQATAARLGIPCFMIDERTFADPYAVPRTMRALVAATPVGQLVSNTRPQPVRETLVDQILKTDLLQKPAWAA